MRVSLRADSAEMDVRVSGADDSITIGDLFAAAGLGAATGPILVDGRRCDASTPLSAVDPADGAILARLRSPRGRTGPGQREQPVVRLVSVAGPGAGRHRDLGPGTWDLCVVDTTPPPRATEADPAGSGLVRLEVSIDGGVRFASIGDGPVVVDGFPTGETLRAGSWVSVGNAVFRVEPARAVAERPAAVTGGRTAFVRTPRVREPERSEPLLAPTPPEMPRDPEPLSWLVMLLPLPVAIIMAFVFSPFFLMFSLLSPITALARNHDAKRRKRKALVTNAETRDRDLLAFLDQLDRRRAAVAADRRQARGDLSRLADRARSGDPSLWRSRSDHDDFLRPVIGVGPAPWEPEILGPLEDPELQAAVAQGTTVPMAPVTVDLRAGTAVGIVGPVEARRALAATVLSSLVVEHGPADLALAALLDQRSARSWDHLKWLPHLFDERGALRVASTIEEAEPLVARQLPEPERQAFGLHQGGELETPVPVVLVDADDMIRIGAQPLAARLTRGQGRAIVLADTVEDLPAFCTSYCLIDPGSGALDLVDVTSGAVTPDIAGAYADRGTVIELSRSLARFTDPESPTAASTLPDFALLTDLLPIEPSGPGLERAWADPPAGCRSILGAGDDGPLEIELLRDGPHALVAGTTGAGKSELLRTMIVSLAARYGPDRVTFVLVDFKGGGAFDVFADLPHNVGVVTDLDEHLSARALRCLQAELKHREHRLREAGVSDLVDLPAPGPGSSIEPLPRLLIVVDEFATLAAELPDFMASLIDVAQRGRSLGIHMVLATQRPTGVVDAKIRANTNLRIALRVQDDGDSMDVIGGRAAAEIDRRHPGRAFARFGASELVGFQTALVSVITDDRVGPALRLDPFDLLDTTTETEGPRFGGDDDGPDDLARYVTAAAEAAEALGLPAPRVPWPDPLPAELPAEDLLDGAGDRPWSTPFGLVDLPDEQCQRPAWWSPEDGNAVFYGIEPGASAAAVATVVLGLAHRHDADDFHTYVLDFGGSLSALRQLPHTGGYVNPDDDERLMRTLQLLENELDRRRRLVEAAQIDRLGPASEVGEPTPLVVVAIANYGAVLEAFEELGDLTAPNRLAQIVRDGPSLGLFTLVASSSERDVPNRVNQQIEAKFVLRMADPNAYLMFGLKPKEVPDLVAGRAIDTRTGHEIQIARFGRGDLRRSIESTSWRTGRRGPERVPVLDAEIDFDRIRSAGSAGDVVWHLPVGLSADDLTPVGVELRVGRHAVVTGPSGAGKTTALQTMAAAARASDPDALIALASSRPDEWTTLAGPLGLVTLDYLLSPESEAEVGRRTLILVDGFDSLPLPETELEVSASRPLDGLHLVVAARPDSFRMPPPWIRAVLSHRTGIAIHAAPEHGDVFRCRFPTPKSQVPPGRCYVVNEGISVAAQIALPPEPGPDGADQAMADEGVPVGQ